MKRKEVDLSEELYLLSAELEALGFLLGKLGTNEGMPNARIALGIERLISNKAEAVRLACERLDVDDCI